MYILQDTWIANWIYYTRRSYPKIHDVIAPLAATKMNKILISIENVTILLQVKL